MHTNQTIEQKFNKAFEATLSHITLYKENLFAIRIRKINNEDDLVELINYYKEFGVDSCIFMNRRLIK